MNQGTAKALRKVTGFKVHKPRTYERVTWKNGSITYVAVKDRAIYQISKQEYLENKHNGNKGKPIRISSSPKAVASDVQIIE